MWRSQWNRLLGFTSKNSGNELASWQLTNILETHQVELEWHTAYSQERTPATLSWVAERGGGVREEGSQGERSLREEEGESLSFAMMWSISVEFVDRLNEAFHSFNC